MDILVVLASLVVSLATAAPPCQSLPTTPSDQPPATSTTSPNFRLVADVTSGDFSTSIQNWWLSSYHIGPCYDYAILTEDPHEAEAFYVNGTDADVRNRNADILTDGATPTTPYGLVISQMNDTDDEGRRTVFINCGEGTSGAAIGSTRDGRPILVADSGGFGGWYACNETLPYGPAVLLYYQGSDDIVPEGCAHLVLYPEW